jgi:hypothetical protein
MFRKLLSSITLVLLIGMALTGTARGTKLDNPMTEDLDAAGYNIFDVNDLDVDGDASVGGNLDVTGTIIAEIFKTTGCTATGTKAVAFGYQTEASGGYSTAMGYDTLASGDYGTAMGYITDATGSASTSMGSDTIASGTASTALGYKTEASGDYSTAMGSGSLVRTTASGYCSTAIGYMAKATGDYSAAIGSSVTAGPADSTIAIGASFTNNVANSFYVGFGNGDFSVKSGQVNVYGDLDVSQKVTMGTLVLPVKSTTGDPASPIEGQIYVNTNDNKVRVYADGAWRDLATW